MIHDHEPFIRLPRLRPLATLGFQPMQAGENARAQVAEGGSALDHPILAELAQPPASDRAGEPAPGGGDRHPPAGALFAGVPVAALEDVMACRVEQVERWGHTPAKDRERPLAGFLADVHSYATAAREDLQYREGLPRVRQRLVKLAALTLAAIDRVDAEPSAPEPRA